MNENKLYKKLVIFAQNHLHRKYGKRALCLLNYYAAIAYFEIDNFRVGYPHVTEAVKLS